MKSFFTHIKQITIKPKMFLWVILVFMLYYNYQHTCFLRPQGLHQWRQSVGASYAMNYYNNHLDITQPQIYNHIAEDGTSDVAIADFPLFYYFTGVLYSIFGNYESIFRIVNAILMLIGLYYFLLAVRKIGLDYFWSFFVTIVLFTSPTLVYYANGFLPDTTAMALALIGFYFIVKYYFSRNLWHLYIASIFYSLAGLIKVTSLISFLAILGAFILLIIFSKKSRAEFLSLKLIIPAILPILLVIVWNLVIYNFNMNRGGVISDVHLRAIWDMNEADVTSTWNRIHDHWLNSYMHISVQIFALILFVVSLIFYKRSNRFFNLVTGLTLIGSAFFFFAFFKSLLHHDYDLINIFILIPFGIICGLVFFKNVLPKLYHSKYLKLIVFAWVVFLAFECKEAVHYKYYGYYNNNHKNYYYGLVDIEEYNRSIGIKQKDLVVSIPDNSINITLNLMNQPGFTGYGFLKKKGKERMDFFISRNAKYLIINDTSIYKRDTYEYLKPFLNTKIGQYKNIGIYKLQQ